MSKKDTQCFKGLGILFMLIFHVFSQGGHIGEMKFLLVNESILNTFSLGCQLCVSIFVFVTAYGTASQYHVKKINDAAKITKYTGTRYIKLMMEFWFVYIAAFLFAAYKNQITQVYGNGNWNYVWIDFMGRYMNHGTPTLNTSWWFMSMAQTLIFVLPPFILIGQRLGIVVFMLFGWASFYSLNLGLSDYFYVVIMGVGLAQCNLISKVTGYVKCLRKWKQVVLSVACLVGILFIPFFRNAVVQELVYSNPVHTFFLCIFVCVLIRSCLVAEKVLQILGRHATNMWLIHVFIYSTYYQELVFRWKYPIVILAVLLCLSLLGSIFLEYMKKILRYEKLSSQLCKIWETAVDKIEIQGCGHFEKGHKRGRLR